MSVRAVQSPFMQLPALAGMYLYISNHRSSYEAVSHREHVWVLGGVG